MKRYALLFICFSFLFSACATYHGGSFVSTELPLNKSQIIVDKVAERLAAVYPPGRTTLYLDLIEADPFGQALEAKLRASGFKLENSDLHLTYTVDSIQDNEALVWYVNIRLSDGFSFAQAFDLGATPKAIGNMTQVIPSGD